MTEPTHRVLIGDCRESMATLPAGSVHCCVTSPPYYNLRDYQIAGQIGLERSPEEFIGVIVGVFREVRRVLRDDGTLFVNLGDSYGDGKQLLGMPWRVALALQADGWVLRQDIVWSKPAPMPESVRDRCTKSHEYIFLLTKRPRYFYDAEAVREDAKYGRRDCSGPPRKGRSAQSSAMFRSVGSASEAVDVGSRTVSGSNPETGRNRRSVWTINTEAFRGAHFATFPTRLVEPCILAGTSAAGCCESCGKPWERVVERGESSWQARKEAGHRSNRGGSIKLQLAFGATHDFDNSAGGFGTPSTVLTTGWRAACTCSAPAVPCTVLDPFGGSGTTAGVALHHRRNAILCELNPEYAAMVPGRIDDVIRRMRKREAKREAKKRVKPLAGQKSLFAEVAP